MKFFIDIQEKTVSLESEETLGDFFKVMEKMFPEDWKTYKLKQATVSYPTYHPIIYDYQYPNYPFDNPKFYCSTSPNGIVNHTVKDNPSTCNIYNVDVKNLN